MTLATNMGVALDNARLFGELSAALAAKSEAETRYRRLVEELPLTLYIDQPDERAQVDLREPDDRVDVRLPGGGWFDDDSSGIIHPDDREQVLANHVASSNAATSAGRGNTAAPRRRAHGVGP